jgi:hypothetical protein
MLLAGAGQPDRAAADFARALELIPQDLHVFHARALLCMKLAREPAAFERLLSLRSSDSLLWYVRAIADLVRSEPKAAVADFVRGGEPPATTEFAFMYAGALLLAGDEQSYAGYVARQAELHGDSSVPFTLYVLARMAALADKPPVPPARILAWASKAATTEPGLAWFAHARGIAAIRAGDMALARRAVEESERLPWGFQFLKQLALSLIDVREGRADSARTRLERARDELGPPRSGGTIAGRHNLLDVLEFQVFCPQIEGPLFDRVFPTDVFTP